MKPMQTIRCSAEPRFLLLNLLILWLPSTWLAVKSMKIPHFYMNVSIQTFIYKGFPDLFPGVFPMFGFSRGTELPEAWTERPPASPGQGVGWLVNVG